MMDEESNDMPPPAAECKIPLDSVAVESGSIDDTTREKNKKYNLLQSIGKWSKNSLPTSSQAAHQNQLQRETQGFNWLHS